VRRAALVCLALGLTGCRTFGEIPEPEVTVETLEVTFTSASRGTLDLGVKVRGGGEAIRAQWQLLLDGQPLGSGVSILAHTLADQAPTVVRLSAPLLTTHAARDEGWRTVTLEISGELTVQRRLEERLQFGTRKQVLIRGAPKF
jgi:hypothetical protein